MLESGQAPESGTATRSAWSWHPELPLPGSPVSVWPIKPFAFLKVLVGGWLPISEKLIIAALSILTWAWLSPALERCREFEFGWMAQIYVRNLLLLILVAGGLHLYLYTFRRQNSRFRYESRGFKHARRFTFNNQVHDNIFWSLASGVTMWTAYEIAGMWAYANGLMPFLSWNDNPAWFIAMFLLIPLFGANVHFYWIHRLLHWRPLYRTAHYLHHRNVATGPWSGLSMHPVEHLLYLSSCLIHVVVASHPVHFIFHLQTKVLQAPTSHSGFEKITAGDESDGGLKLGDFFHQLHHRYFECNYGGPEIPFDQWCGTYHDGTPEATKRVRERARFRGVDGSRTTRAESDTRSR